MSASYYDESDYPTDRRSGVSVGGGKGQWPVGAYRGARS